MLSFCLCVLSVFFFFFNDTATTEIYTLSLHDALPILSNRAKLSAFHDKLAAITVLDPACGSGDRKSTRLNSSHTVISYAVFCLKKKKKKQKQTTTSNTKKNTTKPHTTKNTQAPPRTLG